MMRPALLLLLPLLLVLLNPVASRLHVVHHDSIKSIPTPLHDICANSDYPDICVSTALPYAPSHSTIDELAVIDMLLKGSVDRTRTAIASATSAAKNATPLVASNLKECLAGYQDALDAIASARKAVKESDSQAAMSHLSAAITAYEDCVNTFEDRPATNPVKPDVESLQQVISTLLTVTRVAFHETALPGGG